MGEVLKMSSKRQIHKIKEWGGGSQGLGGETTGSSDRQREVSAQQEEATPEACRTALHLQWALVLYGTLQRLLRGYISTNRS